MMVVRLGRVGLYVITKGMVSVRLCVPKRVRPGNVRGPLYLGVHLKYPKSCWGNHIRVGLSRNSRNPNQEISSSLTSQIIYSIYRLNNTSDFDTNDPLFDVRAWNVLENGSRQSGTLSGIFNRLAKHNTMHSWIPLDNGFSNNIKLDTCQEFILESAMYQQTIVSGRAHFGRKKIKRLSSRIPYYSNSVAEFQPQETFQETFHQIQGLSLPLVKTQEQQEIVNRFLQLHVCSVKKR